MGGSIWPPPPLDVRGLIPEGISLKMKVHENTRGREGGGARSEASPPLLKSFIRLTWYLKHMMSFFTLDEKMDFTDIANVTCSCSEDRICLRWFETVFHFPFQLNFMKGLLVCSKRLLLLVDSRCCNNLSIYQLLCSHWHFWLSWQPDRPQIHSISSIQLHFTQKVVGKLPFLLHQKLFARQRNIF